MSVRKSVLGVVAGALAATTVLAGATPAHAVVGPLDSSFAPADADLIGVGSDTSQGAMFLLSEAWNAQDPAPAHDMATFGAAVQNGTTLEGCSAPINPDTCRITLPVSGSVVRPNGSTAGKSRLYGASNLADVDYARSSAALSATEVNNGLQAFPFAVDTMVMTVSNNVTSNAPTALTPQQIVDIYKGTVTNWNQVGGQAGQIKPIRPQTDSGTYAFFNAQLTALNGGTPVTYGPNVVDGQEHDDALIKNDPNAVAPFSLGRAGLLGTTLRIETGWSAQRALYNVVRGADVTNPKVQAAFGPNGFVCSDDATDLIIEAGFGQLARVEDGGVCGQATTSPTSNFTENEPVEPIVTATELAGSSPKAQTAKLVATVTSDPTAEGTVTFLDGDAEVAADVPLIGGTATATVTGQTIGQHNYTAAFEPAEDTAFEASEDSIELVVKASATITESFPAKVGAGDKAKGTVTVALNNLSDVLATGKVKIKEGTKTLAEGTLKNGKVTLTLPVFKKRGEHDLKAQWVGDANGVKTTKKFTITQK